MGYFLFCEIKSYTVPETFLTLSNLETIKLSENGVPYNLLSTNKLTIQACLAFKQYRSKS